MTDKLRRQHLKTLSLAGAGLSLWSLNGCSTASVANSTDSDAADKVLWQQADAIIASIAPTQFAQHDFVITVFGAKAEPDYDSSAAITAAIAACAEAGGGRVVVPAGRFNTGPVHLKSNVNLHLQKDAVLSFFAEPERYLPAVHTRWEGVELMGYSPLIYAFEQENIGVTGDGILEGNGSNTQWWPWKGKW
ncbi:MAG TPA: glycoside hydrolase, partial [Rheinheimera sp.]|nr:glycoside hydrolase [Rheinheimera sp.]